MNAGKVLGIMVAGFFVGVVLMFAILGGIDSYNRYQISLVAKPLFLRAINSDRFEE